MPKPNKLSAHDLVVIVMGVGGSGKSNFIKKACGGNYGQVNDKQQAQRPNIQTAITKHPDNHRVVFVDTPGLDNPYASDEAILNQIADWLVSSSKAGVTFAAIIYLHRITDNRMPHSSCENLKLFTGLCGQAAMRNVILVTSMWDADRQGVGEQREEELKTKFWKEMLDNGCKTARFENTRESAWMVLGDLQGSRTTLQLQDELVRGRKQVHETKAYSSLPRKSKDWKSVLFRIFGL